MRKYTFHGMESEEEWNWLHARAECVRCADTVGLCCYRDGQLVGAVALDTWSHNSCVIHIAFEDFMSFRHGWPEAVFGYVFNQCDKGVIVGSTPACNEKALRFNKHIGFVELFRIKDGFEEGIDTVIQEYRKENCKYIRNEDGQVRSQAA